MKSKMERKEKGKRTKGKEGIKKKEKERKKSYLYWG